MTTIVLDTDVSSLIIKRQLPARLAAALAGHLPSITFFTLPSASLGGVEDGRPIHPDVVRQPGNRLVVRLDLPPIRRHDVRHSYATAALSAGIHPKIVSERLGHPSVAFTLTQYSHVLPGVDQEAAKTIADLMLGRGSVSNSVGSGPTDATRAPLPKERRPGRTGSGGRI